jgi:hypothetical protein
MQGNYITGQWGKDNNAMAPSVLIPGKCRGTDSTCDALLSPWASIGQFVKTSIAIILAMKLVVHFSYDYFSRGENKSLG